MGFCFRGFLTTRFHRPPPSFLSLFPSFIKFPRRRRMRKGFEWKAASEGPRRNCDRIRRSLIRRSCKAVKRKDKNGSLLICFSPEVGSMALEWCCIIPVQRAFNDLLHLTNLLMKVKRSIWLNSTPSQICIKSVYGSTSNMLIAVEPFKTENFIFSLKLKFIRI